MSEQPSGINVHPKVAELSGLTFLRFVPAVFVILYHYIGLTPGTYGHAILGLGYTSVTFFFLLSGFILAYNYERVDFTARSSIIKFLAARVARIYPLYLLSLIVGLGPFVVAVSKPTMEPLMRKLYLSDLVLAPLSLESWVPGASVINFPSWSISTECFFYCCFPFVVRRVLAAPCRWMVITIISWLLVNAVCYALWSGWGPDGQTIVTLAPAATTHTVMLAEFIKFFPLLRLPEFIAGILAYVYWSRYRNQLPAAPLLALTLAAFATLASLSDRLPTTLLHNGLSAVVWIPLILAGAQSKSPVFTSSRSVFLGKLSFALYLFHAPCIAYVNAVAKRTSGVILTPNLVVGIALLLTVSLSVITHVWIEESMRRRVYRAIVRRFHLPD